jgi:hypothetical protein
MGGVYGGGNHSGEINVTAENGAVSVLGGPGAEADTTQDGDGAGAYAQIGHGGGWANLNNGGFYEGGAHCGDVNVTAEEGVILQGGAYGYSLPDGPPPEDGIVFEPSGPYAQIGHGGAYSNGNFGTSRIDDYDGYITYSYSEEQGGYYLGGNHFGNVSVTALDGDVSLDGGAAQGAYAQIGHGGRWSGHSEGTSYINYDGVGHWGDVLVSASGSVSLTSQPGEAYCQIGHGGYRANQNEFYPEPYGAQRGTGVADTGAITTAFDNDQFLTAPPLPSETGIAHYSYDYEGDGETRYIDQWGGEYVGGGHVGSITVTAGGDVVLSGASEYACGYAQIGHGGKQSNQNDGGVYTGGSHDGDVAVTAGGAVTMEGGHEGNLAQIGHGGYQANNNYGIGFQMVLSEPNVGASAAPTQFGNFDTLEIWYGGVYEGGNHNGNVTVNAVTDVTLTGGAQVGHGGAQSCTNYGGFYGFLYGPSGSHNGDITVTAGQDVLLTGTETGYAQIGHGGPGANSNYSAGLNCLHFAIGQNMDIGTYETLGLAAVYNGGSHTGDIDVRAGRDIYLVGAADEAQLEVAQYTEGCGAGAQIGHGGYLANCNENGFYGTGSTFLGETAPSGSHTGNITVLSGQDVVMLAGDRTDAAVQIGHGGPGSNSNSGGETEYLSYDTYYGGELGYTYGGVYVGGSHTGNIIVGTGRYLILTGGETGGDVGPPDSVIGSGGAYAQIGHGGAWSNSNYFGFYGEGGLGNNSNPYGVAGTISEPSGNHTGNIYINPVGGMLMQGGVGPENYAQVGHGGAYSNANFGGEYEGGYVYPGYLYAEEGAGGVYNGGSHNGAITVITPNNLWMLAGEDGAMARIGHGGFEANLNEITYPETAAPTFATFTPGYTGAPNGGNIVVVVGGYLTMTDGAEMGALGYNGRIQIFLHAQGRFLIENGARLNGVVFNNGLPAGSYGGMQWNKNTEFEDWAHEYWGPYQPFDPTIPYNDLFTIYYDIVPPEVFEELTLPILPIYYDQFERYEDYGWVPGDKEEDARRRIRLFSIYIQRYFGELLLTGGMTAGATPKP